MRKAPTLIGYLVSGTILLALLCFAAYICWKVVAYGFNFINPGIVWSAELTDNEEDAIGLGYETAQKYYDFLNDCKGQIKSPDVEFTNLTCWLQASIDTLCEDLGKFRLCPSLSNGIGISDDIDDMVFCGHLLDSYMEVFKKKNIKKHV